MVLWHNRYDESGSVPYYIAILSFSSQSPHINDLRSPKEAMVVAAVAAVADQHRVGAGRHQAVVGQHRVVVGQRQVGAGQHQEVVGPHLVGEEQDRVRDRVREKEHNQEEEEVAR